MNTTIIIALILLFMIYAIPNIISYLDKKSQNDKLLSNMQNLHHHYNKNVVRGNDGRFKSKNEINK